MEDLGPLERLWQARVPPLLRALFADRSAASLLGLHLLDPGALAEGAERLHGLPPRFLPFGEDRETARCVGLWADSGPPEMWSIAAADLTVRCLLPAATSLPLFVRLQTASARSSALDAHESLDTLDRDLRAVARLLDLPPHLIDQPPARTEAEIDGLRIALDPGDVLAKCATGCRLRWQGNIEAAIADFASAHTAAPQFGDALYLAADLRRAQDRYDLAVPLWWETVRSAVCWCSVSTLWDLGDEHPEADIYELAADALSQFGGKEADRLRDDPLWRVAVEGDAYDPFERMTLADTLLHANDELNAERELLNAIYLAAGGDDPARTRAYERLIALYRSQGRQREAALARFDAAREAGAHETDRPA